MPDFAVIFVNGPLIEAVNGPNANRTFTAATGDLANGAAAVQSQRDGKYVAFPVAGATKASFTTDTGVPNANLTFTAVQPGPEGNNIRIRYNISGNNTPLSVSVSTLDITINLATNGSGVATSTANAIMAAVQASSPATALVTVALAPGNTGVGIPLSGISFVNLGAGNDGGATASNVVVALAADVQTTTF